MNLKSKYNTGVLEYKDFEKNLIIPQDPRSNTHHS